MGCGFKVRIDRLKRRAAHLEERIAETPGLSYDKGELSALRYIIKQVTELKESNVRLEKLLVEARSK